jgi:hypothetical protein
VEEPQIDLGFELLKYSLVLGTMPFWLPFAKALWQEFTKAMRPDGGLSGRVPSPRERREIEAHIEATEDSSQVHEPIAHRRGRATGPSQTGRALSPPAPGQPTPRGGPQLGGQRRAFTPGQGGRAGANPGGRRGFR